MLYSDVNFEVRVKMCETVFTSPHGSGQRWYGISVFDTVGNILAEYSDLVTQCKDLQKFVDRVSSQRLELAQLHYLIDDFLGVQYGVSP